LDEDETAQKNIMRRFGVLYQASAMELFDNRGEYLASLTAVYKVILAKQIQEVVALKTFAGGVGRI